MNFSWAIRIARDDAASLAGLRLLPGLEIGEIDELLWLRGRAGDEQLDARLAALPASGRYEWLAPNQLRLVDHRIPSERLPDLHWQPLNVWLQVESPDAALPATEPNPVPLRLARSTDERDPDLLLTNLAVWKSFGTSAAQVRLDRLEFAADDHGQVLVRGRPLPPLPGVRYVSHGPIAIPAGYSWQPAVGADVLARVFGASEGALVLWNEDGTMTRLHAEQFVPAMRSALRATGAPRAESR
jgi:hypothetical protein